MGVLQLHFGFDEPTLVLKRRKLVATFNAEAVDVIVVVGRDGLSRTVDDVEVVGELRPLRRYVNISTALPEPSPVSGQTEAIRPALSGNAVEIAVGLPVVESNPDQFASLVGLKFMVKAELGHRTSLGEVALAGVHADRIMANANP